MGNKQKTTYVNVTRQYNQGMSTTGPTSGAIPLDVKALSYSRVGSNDPMFRTKIRNGANAVGNLDVTVQEIVKLTPLMITVVGTKKPVPGVSAGNLGQFASTSFDASVSLYPLSSVGTISAARMANAENGAATGILKKLNQQTQAVTGLVFVGEIRESIKMILNPAAGLRALTLRLLDKRALSVKDQVRQELIDKGLTGAKAKKARESRARQMTRDVSNAWLEWVFGAVPLMHDIEDAADASLRLQEASIKRLSFMSRDSNASTLSSRNFPGQLTGLYCTTDRLTTSEYSVRYTIGVKVEGTMDKTPLQRLVMLSGFDLSAVIPSAWELLPFSFLIDYFSNIGSVLEAHCTSRENVVWSIKGEKSTFTLRYTTAAVVANGNQTGNYALSSYTPQHYEHKTTVIKRRAAAVPFPELRFSLPGSRGQYFNMAALLTALTK